MATAVPDYYCHKCQVHIGHVTNFQCPYCRDSFIEEIVSQHSSSRSRSNRPRNVSRIHFHGSPQLGGTTIFIGGSGAHPSNPRYHHQADNSNIGIVFQTLFAQLAGGGQHFPLFVQSGGGRGVLGPGDLDVLLTQFLNQVGENSGPAPASEDRINSIPTVKITSAQARDNLQCAICMEEFKRNDEAKRLPCSHHFHEECISRWLRMHGTCPTCRVTLEGDNTTNQEYDFYPDQDQWNNNNNNNHRRRQAGGNNGSHSTLFDFD